LWDFSLVDPDNRRPVDYPVRQQLLARVKGAVASGKLAVFAAEALEDKDIL
jgi:maltooligosyltrehalose synthase